MAKFQPPKDDLVRAVSSVEMRAEDESPTLFGHFSVFNQWTEIDSAWEGRFLERIAPGAFSKTFQDRAGQIQVLFNHGQDPEIGDKILGDITDLREDETGARYEVSLFDGIPPLVMGGLRANKYGSSFRFKVTRDDIVDEPKASDHNPDALPERTVREVNLYEFGPVTFPAYATATAGVRSMTDEYIVDRFRSRPDRLRELIASIQVPAPSEDAEPAPTSEERRVDQVNPRFRSRKEYLSWLIQP